MRGANPHHESNADLYALDLPVELEAQESAVSPKLHSGCFKTTDKLIASLRRTFLCGADTRGNESWRGLQRQTPRNNIPCITSSFDHTRANKQMLAAKLGIAHTLCISFEVICLGANLLGHLGIGSVDGPQHAHEFFDFPFIQQALLVDLHPSFLFDFLMGIQLTRHFPQMLTSMI